MMIQLPHNLFGEWPITGMAGRPGVRLMQTYSEECGSMCEKRPQPGDARFETWPPRTEVGGLTESGCNGIVTTRWPQSTRYPESARCSRALFFARWFLRTDKKEANIEQPVVAASGVDLTAGEVKELKACASFDNVRYGILDSKVELDSEICDVTYILRTTGKTCVD